MTAKPHVWRFAWADSLRTLVAIHREVPGDGVDITAADARRLVAAVREGGPWKAVAAHGGGPAMLIDVGRATSAGTALDEVRAQDAGLHRESVRAYSNLAELLGACFVFEDGIFGTPNNPPPMEFVKPALDVFTALQKRHGEEHVLTGEWLEQLAVKHGIHPVATRERLEEARSGGLLQRYVEGSSPATGQRTRPISVLVARRGRPTIEQADLYDGRFLLTDRAAVRVRLVEGKNGSEGTS